MFFISFILIFFGIQSSWASETSKEDWIQLAKNYYWFAIEDSGNMDLFARAKHYLAKGISDAEQYDSIDCGAGVGCFLLTDRLQVLLIRGSHMCTYPSIYVDKNGEVETMQHSNKPLYLSTSRYRKLARLYASHGIADYVVHKRSTEDRVLRPNWF